MGKNVGSSAATGAAAGGTVGTIIPGIGNAVGAAIGTAVGAIVGFLGFGQAKKKIKEYTARAEALIAVDEQQSRTIKILAMGLIGLLLFLVIYLFVLRRKK